MTRTKAKTKLPSDAWTQRNKSAIKHVIAYPIAMINATARARRPALPPNVPTRPRAMMPVDEPPYGYSASGLPVGRPRARYVPHPEHYRAWRAPKYPSRAAIEDYTWGSRPGVSFNQRAPYYAPGAPTYGPSVPEFPGTSMTHYRGQDQSRGHRTADLFESRIFQTAFDKYNRWLLGDEDLSEVEVKSEIKNLRDYCRILACHADKLQDSLDGIVNPVDYVNMCIEEINSRRRAEQMERTMQTHHQSYDALLGAGSSGVVKSEERDDGFIQLGNTFYEY